MMNWAKIYNAEACLERLTSWKSLFELDLFDVQISMKLIGLSRKKTIKKKYETNWKWVDKNDSFSIKILGHK